MELNSVAEALLDLAGTNANEEAVELELSVLKLKGSPLYSLLEKIALKQKGIIHERNVFQKEDYQIKKCA